MPAPAGDSPRVVSVAFSQLEVPGQQREQRQLAVGGQLAPVRRRATARSVSIERSSIRPSVARLDLGVRAQADGGVERRRAVVKEVERPDVDRAAGQVDAGRRGRDDVHDGNYTGSLAARAGDRLTRHPR